MRYDRRGRPGKVRRLIAVLAGGRRWLRSCADCRAYQHYESGESAGQIETCPQSDRRGGVVHLPMARDANCSPPCDECPKIDPREPVKHWRHAVEFEPWFWDAWQWFEEGRACGTLGEADPLMRQVAAEFDRHAERLRARASAAPILEFFTHVLAGG